MKLRILALSAVLAGFGASGAEPALPGWFPMQGLQINPDKLAPEDYGSDDFDVAAKPGADPQTVTVKGRHWATDLYPAGSSSDWVWNGRAVWKAMRPRLEQQGFSVVYLQDDGNVGATLRRSAGGSATYVEVFLSADDAHSNWVRIVEAGGRSRTLQLVPPAARPEAFTDRQDFPYVTPLPGAKLLDTHRYDLPLDVTGDGDTEPRLVGSGHIEKQYEGPAGVSAEDFDATYRDAFRQAGWAIVPAGKGFHAHWSRNGRALWVTVFQEGGARWDIEVADVGSALAASLRQGCKAALYGLNFDFDKATLRPDSEPVLQPVLAMLGADPAAAFELDGHTDDIGGKDYNLRLSAARADAVKAWLVAHGAAAARLSTRGFGDAQPVAANDSDAHRALNRRVELVKTGCR